MIEKELHEKLNRIHSDIHSIKASCDIMFFVASVLTVPVIIVIVKYLFFLGEKYEDK